MIRKAIISLMLCVACCHLHAQSFPLPILKGDYPDPTILRDGNDYYMTHSPFFYMPGFLIWHSTDLMNWEPIGRAMAEWRGNAMAPDLVKVDGRYYIYYPANRTNYVIWADDIRGPWSKPIDLGIGGIDPGHIATPDGKRYLFTSKGQVTPLTPDGLSKAGETVKVYDGWQYPSEWETECFCRESPKLTYHDGYYYMTSAEGGTAGPATSHMIVSARSRSIMGPWENSPYNPIVHTWSAAEKWWSKGHGSLVEDTNGQWWVVYHAYDRDAYSLGRQTLIEPIEWTKGGWFRPVYDYPTYIGSYGRMPSHGLSDDFSSTGLGWQWMGWKENIAAHVRFAKGVLTLPSRGTSPKNGRVMMTTAEDRDYAVEAQVTVGRNNQAGLLLFYNANASVGLMSDGKQFYIYNKEGESERVTDNPALPRGLKANRFHVRLENHSGSLDILLSSDGKQWIPIRRNMDISQMHHNNLREFLALRPALVSVGEGDARFDYFNYTPLVAGNPVRGDYGYLYCHMSDAGEWTAYALSRDGLHYDDLLEGGPVFDNAEHARIEGGTRDAYLARSCDGDGYLMVTTDMCVKRSKQWFNYGIDLLRSSDLIHWQSTTFDFRKGPSVFCDPESPDVYKDWSTVCRVWAPQFVWDPNYLWPDGERGGYFVYYSLWNKPEEAYDRMYYSYADRSFTRLTKPRLLFDWGYATIDADINYIPADGLYHMLIKKEGGRPGIYTATSERLTGPWSVPVEDDYVSFEGNKKCEGSSAFQLIGDSTWRVAYVEYSSRPHRYRICQTDAHLRGFRDPVDIQGVKAPQHGSFLRLTRAEYDRLWKWGIKK